MNKNTCGSETLLRMCTFNAKNTMSHRPSAAAMVWFSPVQRVLDQNQELNHGLVLQNSQTQNQTIENHSQWSSSFFFGLNANRTVKSMKGACGHSGHSEEQWA
jgi:hypothetical protein